MFRRISGEDLETFIKISTVKHTLHSTCDRTILAKADISRGEVYHLEELPRDPTLFNSIIIIHETLGHVLLGKNNFYLIPLFLDIFDDLPIEYTTFFPYPALEYHRRFEEEYVPMSEAISRYLQLVQSDIGSEIKDMLVSEWYSKDKTTYSLMEKFGQIVERIYRKQKGNAIPISTIVITLCYYLFTDHPKPKFRIFNRLKALNELRDDDIASWSSKAQLEQILQEGITDFSFDEAWYRLIRLPLIFYVCNGLIQNIGLKVKPYIMGMLSLFDDSFSPTFYTVPSFEDETNARLQYCHFLGTENLKSLDLYSSLDVIRFYENTKVLKYAVDRSFFDSFLQALRSLDIVKKYVFQYCSNECAGKPRCSIKDITFELIKTLWYSHTIRPEYLRRHLKL